MNTDTPIPTSGGRYAEVDGKLVPCDADGKPIEAKAEPKPAEPKTETKEPRGGFFKR